MLISKNSKRSITMQCEATDNLLVRYYISLGYVLTVALLLQRCVCLSSGVCNDMYCG